MAVIVGAGHRGKKRCLDSHLLQIAPTGGGGVLWPEKPL